MPKYSLILVCLCFSSVFTSCTDDTETPTSNTTTTDNSLPTSITLVDIAAGTFTMGGSTMANDAPEVSVSISAFMMSEKEITNQQYIDFLNDAIKDGWVEVVEENVADPCGSRMEKVVKGIGSAPNAGEIYIQLGETGGCTSGGEPEAINNKSWIAYANGSFNLLDNTKSDWPVPVNWVKWYGANAFVQYYNLDLPTEAQWEYAARGGQQLQYPTDDGTLSASKANYNGDAPGVYDPDGHSVATGSYPSNPFKLYDMGGNVWEWCQDYYIASFYTDDATDPVNTSPGADSKRVRRGGSWNYHSATLLSYARASDFENRGNNHFGFRIVKNAN